MTAIVTAANGLPYVYRPVAEQAVHVADRTAGPPVCTGLLRAFLDPHKHEGPSLALVLLPGQTRPTERVASAIRRTGARPALHLVPGTGAPR
jgi:hypothetical protein